MRAGHFFAVAQNSGNTTHGSSRQHGRIAATMLSLPDLAQVHDRFLTLSRIARECCNDSLGGKLLLRSRLDADGIASVVGASIAGAVSLCVDDDASRLREGLRAGLIDFVVANLDEALRILKNEIRRALPVSVGLTTDPVTSIGEMIKRGLQPDLLSGVQADNFVEHGALAVPDDPSPDPETSLVEWTVAESPAQSMARIAQFAANALDPARIDTHARRRWLQQAPRYLGRAFSGRQCLRMTGSEVSSLLPLARTEIPSVEITRNGQRI